MNRKWTASWLTIISLMGLTSAYAQDATVDATQDVAIDTAAREAEKLEAISKAMDNPVGELIILQNQLDYYFVEFPSLDETEEAFSYKLIPTFPLKLTKNWNLISRVILQYNSVPINEDAGDLIGFSLGQIIADKDLNQKLQNVTNDPFDTTSGFGDTTYLGLIAPREPLKTKNGTFLWGVGPALMFDTAEKEVLGVGADSAGVGALAAYITPKWRFGVLPMQFWSYHENSGRSNFNYLNMQYFAFYAPTPTISIGMSPYMTVNWNADSGEQVSLPVGLGINKTMSIGKLPVRVGCEVYYNLIHPDDSAHSEWSARIFFIPVAPAPGSNLAKALAQ